MQCGPHTRNHSNQADGKMKGPDPMPLCSNPIFLRGMHRKSTIQLSQFLALFILLSSTYNSCLGPTEWARHYIHRPLLLPTLPLSLCRATGLKIPPSRLHRVRRKKQWVSHHFLSAFPPQAYRKLLAWGFCETEAGSSYVTEVVRITESSWVGASTMVQVWTHLTTPLLHKADTPVQGEDVCMQGGGAWRGRGMGGA